MPSYRVHFDNGQYVASWGRNARESVKSAKNALIGLHSYAKPRRFKVVKVERQVPVCEFKTIKHWR